MIASYAQKYNQLPSVSLHMIRKKCHLLVQCKCVNSLNMTFYYTVLNGIKPLFTH